MTGLSKELDMKFIDEDISSNSWKKGKKAE